MMKKIVLLFLIIPFLSISQEEGDWFPIPSDQIAYYELIGNTSPGNIKPYRIDSIRNTPDGYEYYNIRTPEIFYYYYNEEGYLHDPYASWLGKKTLINQNNAYIYNKYNRPIYIPFQAPVGEIWRMYEYPNGSYIEAWFSGEENREILEGINDDVKFLNIQIFNEEGVQVDSTINQDTLILSKNYGFVKTYRWYQFPDSFKLGKYLLSGIELDDENYGFEWDYDELISSYEIGDVIHLHHGYFGGLVNEYLSKKIMEDTIEYEIKSIAENYQSMSVEKIHYSMGILPGQSMFNNNKEFIGYKTFDLQTNLWNGRKQYTVRDYFDFDIVEYNGQEYFYREMYISMSDYPFQYLNDVHYYAKDCGPNGDCWNITYFKTKDEEWGESISLQVEDYQTVRPDFIAYFDNGKAIRIDSIKDFEFGKYYYSYNTLERYSNYQDEAILYDFKTSWIGNRIGIFNNGFNVFRDKFNREIAVNTKAEIKDTWRLFQYDDGKYIQAVVIDKSYQMISKSIYDSVKIIKCQAYLADGSATNHSINDYELRLSKNYGFLDMILFYHFFTWTAFDNPVSSLDGIKSSHFSFGNINQYSNSIKSLDIGSELHYRYYSEDYGYRFVREITSKEINGKEIKYGFRLCKNTYGYGYDTTNFYEEIIGEKKFPIDILPGEIVNDESIMGYPFSFTIWRNGETELCNSYPHFSYGFIHGGVLQEYDNQVFWKVYVDDAPHFAIAKRWADEIGWYIWDRGAYSTGDYLDYLVTDQIDCGTPYNFSCDDNIVGQDLIDSKSSVTISPNPSNGLFYITSSEQIEEIKVYNVNGQLVWQELQVENKSIDLTNQFPGIYFVELMFSDGHFQTTKLLLNP